MRTLTDHILQKAKEVEEIVEQYFDENPSIEDVQAKDLMPLFIEKGVFTKDNRKGLPIRNLLRTLDRANRLDLISHVFADRKEKNTYWYFLNPETEFIPGITTTSMSGWTSKPFMIGKIKPKPRKHK